MNQIYASLDTIDYFIKNKNFEEGLNVAKKTIHDAHKSNMQNVSDLSYVYDKKADCEEALNLTDDLEVTLRRNLEIRENSLSPNDIMLAFSYNRLAFLLRNKISYQESIFFEEKAASIFKLLNEDKLYSGSVLSIAWDYKKLSDSDDLEYLFVHRDLKAHSKSILNSSIKYYLEALELEEDPNLNYSLIHESIASAYEKIKDYHRAIYHRLKELAQDPDDTRKARGITFGALSGLYSKINDLEKSLEYSIKEFNYKIKTASTDAEKSILHEQLAASIITKIQNIHDDTELVKLYFLHKEKAHSYNKKSYDVSLSLASMHERRSDIKRAIEVLEVTVKARAVEDNATALMYSRLGGLYGKIGDNTGATEYLNKAKKLIDLSIDFESDQIALKYFLKQKKIMEDSQEYSPIQYAENLGLLGQRYMLLGMLDEAEESLKQQLNLNKLTEVYSENEISKIHYESAVNTTEEKANDRIYYKFSSQYNKTFQISKSLFNLGEIYYKKGNYPESIKLLEESLTLTEEIKGKLEIEDLGIYEHLILLYIHIEYYDKVELLLQKRSELLGDVLSQSLEFLPIQKRLDASKALDPFLFLGSSSDTEFISSTSLRFKGIVLDSIIRRSEKYGTPGLGEYTNHKNLMKSLPQDTVLLDFLELYRLSPTFGTGIKGNYNESSLMITGFFSNASEYVKKSLQRDDEIIAIGNDIQSLTAVNKLTSSQIVNLLTGPKNSEVVIKFIRSGNQRIISLKKSVPIAKLKPSPYHGVAIYSAEKDDPEWLELPSSFLNSTSDENEKQLNFSYLSQEELRQLYKSLLIPVIQKLDSKTKTLIICSDGKLNFIPFHCLLDDNNSFLSEKYEVLQVSALRDLVVHNSNFEASKDFTIFASPDFDINTDPNESELAINSFDRNLMRNLSFSALPGALNEASLIQEIATEKGFSVDTKIGPFASEKYLNELKSPHILHLATHGFFISSVQNTLADKTFDFLNKDGASSQITNPMNRSGLLLAGAKNSQGLRFKGEIIDEKNDGILTAEEASQLDLSKTWLTVLSACDTGSGIARAGEGVLGLRRAFAMAGTQNLLLTLWPVSDSFTKDFMVSFYKEALESGNAPKAMAKVQRDWLVKLREERSISQAVKLAGPFVLTFRGNPELN